MNSGLRRATRFVIVALLLLNCFAVANAAELKVLCSTALQHVLQQLSPSFSAATGIKISATYGTTTSLQKRIAAGDKYDVVILTSSAIKQLVQSGAAISSNTEVAHAAIGVAIRKGAVKPDISSVDALKQTLLRSKSVAYSADGASGIHFATVVERLGITDALKPKTKLVTGASVGAVVAAGDAELGVHMISELLPVDGIEIVGPLPPEVQKITAFSAAIARGSTDVTAAEAFVRFLTSPFGSTAMQHAGLQ